MYIVRQRHAKGLSPVTKTLAAVEKYCVALQLHRSWDALSKEARQTQISVTERRAIKKINQGEEEASTVSQTANFNRL
jgi:hypothetical protein